LNSQANIVYDFTDQTKILGGSRSMSVHTSLVCNILRLKSWVFFFFSRNWNCEHWSIL